MSPQVQRSLRAKWLIPMVLVLPTTIALCGLFLFTPISQAAPPCPTPGWFPGEFGLKDHTVFWYDDYYYIASINVPDDKHLAYGRSADLCNWEVLEPILTERKVNAPDEFAVWAPFVYEEDGFYYLYYTGVGNYYVQSIQLATTRNPADPSSWEPRGVVFQPDHVGMVWEKSGLPNDQWSNCRDASILKVGGVYYMVYTSLDEQGGIVGLAWARHPAGPWEDLGSLVEPEPGAMLESPALIRYGSNYYLFYNRSGSDLPGEYYRISSSILGGFPNKNRERPMRPGWAHEIWQDADGDWFSSYLLDYSVYISPISWDTFFRPPRPFLGAKVYHRLLPILNNYISTYSSVGNLENPR